MSATSIKSDENFLKEFLRGFYQKIIDIDDYHITFENTLSEWIKNITKDTKTILELMQNHEKCELWFSGILGFFYQCGISCDHVDKTKALELYLLAVSNKEALCQKSTTKLHLLEENNDKFASIKSDENFLKEFLRDFYQKIIVICDYLVTFENTLNEWIKNIGKDTKTILELMQNHEKCELWFSGILGFFYQCGIGCDHVDKTKALELYSLAKGP
ncbi:hypothetical protein RhiirA5_370929 [Rhizophagus irregularis]|uniref:Uncharacterized protein n=1 Tax=Rhizophagus irregularis TaxID=588596 RepID=A0A2N0Q7N6_9GLOM|nr:hypothetical protein RhiirA5_370929 [Rhizophagus irregularis]